MLVPGERGPSKIERGQSCISLVPTLCHGFPDSSVGEESACNAGEPSLIPGLGRSAGEGIGYPLQYSGASLAAQLVKNSPVMQETSVPRNFSPWNPRLTKSVACMTPPFEFLKASHNQQVK